MDRTIWTDWLLRTTSRFGYPHTVYLVNPGREEVFGHPCYPSVEALPEVPDVAILIVGAPRAVEECRKLVALGTGEICVIANGFRETGLPEGRELEARLAEVVAGASARVIGPNCVGFARFHEQLCVLTQPLPKGIVAGDVSVISQSGGLTGGLLGALQREGFGFDLCYSIGNGVGFSFEDGLEWAVSRDTTRYVCGIAESVRDVDRVARTARAARDAGKELVLLLLGRSTAGREAARSHTGFVVADQDLLGARLEEHGIWLADSITEQARIVALLRSFGRPDPAKGAFVITASGGGATLTADAAEQERCGAEAADGGHGRHPAQRAPARPVPRQPARRHRRQRPRAASRRCTTPSPRTPPSASSSSRTCCPGRTSPRGTAGTATRSSAWPTLRRRPASTWRSSARSNRSPTPGSRATRAAAT